MFFSLWQILDQRSSVSSRYCKFWFLVWAIFDLFVSLKLVASIWNLAQFPLLSSLSLLVLRELCYMYL